MDPRTLLQRIEQWAKENSVPHTILTGYNGGAEITLPKREWTILKKEEITPKISISTHDATEIPVRIHLEV